MNKARVVIVDDSTFSVMLLTDLLVERGFDVVGAAHSLDEVKTAIKEKNPDLVTMDITIPGTDGFECTEAVHEINPNIKVVFVSSMMDEELVKKAKEYNASGYVQKPVEPDELASILNRIYLSDETLAVIGEFTNIVAGNACSALNRINKVLSLRVAPPSILYGDSLTISGSHFESLLAAASTKFGEIVIHVGFSKLGFSKGNDKWTQSM